MKKILALILAFSVVFSLSAIGIVASENTENADLKFIKAFNFISDENKDSIFADTAVTRIGLAEIFYNVIFPDNNKTNEYWGEADFPDVPAEKKHIAATVYGMGVMRGYSDTVFAPDDPVTYAQAVKAMVSFLGYDLQAQRLGGYPGGYFSQATLLKILPGNNIPGDALATYGGIAALFKKALGAEIAVWNKTGVDGSAILEVQKNVNYLKYYRGVDILRGTVTSNYLTNIYGGDANNFFGVCINDFAMEIEKGAKGIQDLLGYDVHVYYKYDGNVAKAVYYEEGTNHVLEIDSDNISSVTQGMVTYFVDGQPYTYQADFSSKAPLIYNGTYQATYTVEHLNPFAGGEYDGSIKLIDTNGDTTYDNIVVRAFKTVVVGDIRNDKIYNMYEVEPKVVDLTHYKERNINIRDISGDLVEPSVIKKGHIVNVCHDMNGVVKEIIASDDSMTGVIDEISYVGSKITTLKVSGVTFDVANGLTVIDSANKLAPGSVAEIFFNCETEIAVIDLENNYTSGYTLGYLVDAEPVGVIEKNVECLVFNNDGTMVNSKFAKKVVLNGTAQTAEEAFEGLGEVNGRVRRQLILYKTNPDGDMISAIVTAPQIANDLEAVDGFYQYPGNVFSYSGGQKSFNNIYLTNANTVVFSVPEESDRDNYDKYAIGELGNANSETVTMNVDLYGTKATAIVVDYAVIYGGGGGYQDNSRKPFFIVKKVSTAINSEGEEGIKISGTFIEGMGTTVYEGGFFIDEKLLIDGHNLGNSADPKNGRRPFIDQNETLPEPGDVFRFPSFSSTGEIKEMDVNNFYQLYDIGDDKFVADSGVYYDEGSEYRVHLYGTVFMKEGESSIKLQLPDSSKRSVELSSGYSIIEVTKNKQTGEITTKKVSYDAVLAENTHPGEASKILLHYRSSGIGCFVFNIK